MPQLSIGCGSTQIGFVPQKPGAVGTVKSSGTFRRLGEIRSSIVIVKLAVEVLPFVSVAE